MLKMIAIENLYTTKNVRPMFDNEIVTLADSIKKNGLLQPIVVQETEKDRYEIICGHRRFAALKYIGEPVVECNVITLTENRTIVQLIENTQRREMLPWELTAKLFSDYTIASKEKNEITRTYPDGTKVCYLLKSAKRKKFKYKLEFTSEELREKLERFLEQETRI